MANPLTNVNPWKGLNFYKEGEVIYGRNSEIESLSHYIFNNTQTILYGKSGIGKSSILNAGIFPLARKKGMLPIPIRLDHNNDTPYIDQIRQAVVKSGADVHEIVPVIDPAKETLWEYLHRNIFFDKEGNRMQLLIVLDQFEEIFTLQQDEKTKLAFFDDIANLINDITPLYIVNANKKQGGGSEGVAQEVTESLDDLDIDIDIDETSALGNENKYLQKIDHHFVFTLREDFLSYLERYTAYIPSMKSNRYALLPLNEEQAADIIMKPVEGLIDWSVAELIIRKVTGRQDFVLDGIPEIEVDAAVLSLYLSRIFIKKGDQDTITADIVNQFSDDIIKDFYEESVANLPQEEIEHIENRLLTYDGRRNNVSRGDLIQEGVSYGVIKTLVAEKKLLRQFSYQDDIRIEFMHDILCPIVNERIKNREEALKKAEEQRLQEEQRAMILAEEKRKREEIEQLAWEQRKAAMEQRRKIRVRATVTLAIIVFISAIVLGVYFWKYHTYKTYYASFTTENGWPKGMGKQIPKADIYIFKYIDTFKHIDLFNLFTNEELFNKTYKDKMPIYYELVRKGYAGNNYRVNIMNWNKEIVPNAFERLPMIGLYDIEKYDKAAISFILMQRQTCYWIYTPDNIGNLQRRTAYNKNNEVLYSILYYNSDSSDDTVTKHLWASIIDKEGKSLRTSDNGLDRMRITVNNNGRYEKYMFFSENGVPQSNHEGAYGVTYEFNDTTGYITKMQALDAFGDPVKDFGEFKYEKFDDFGRVISSSEYTSKYYYSNYFGVQDSLLFDDNGLWRYHSRHIADSSLIQKFYYDTLGRLAKRYEFVGDTLTDFVKNVYDEKGNLSNNITYTKTKGWKKEIHNDDSISYYKGLDLNNLKCYRKVIIDKSGDSCYYSYYNVDDTGRDTLDYEELKIYNDAGQLWRHIIFDNQGNRTLSLEYEIKDGVVVGEHVMGLDGSIIRCPKWSVKGLCYYRMKYVRDFKGDIVARKAINEFGEESMIVNEENKEIKWSLIPSKLIEEGKNDTMTYKGVSSYAITKSKKTPQNKVTYIHIIDSACYQSGLRDGDLLVENNTDTIRIARPNVEENKFDIKTIFIKHDSLEKFCDIYDVYYTKEEMERYKNSIGKH